MGRSARKLGRDIGVLGSGSSAFRDSRVGVEVERSERSGAV